MNKQRGWIHFLLAGLVLVLTSCASSDRPRPAELGADPALLHVQTAWTARVGRIDFPLDIKVSGNNGSIGNTVWLASSDGEVAALDARTGTDIWRSRVHARISAGVGSDGRYASVVTADNELVTLDAGQELWRVRLTSQVFTAPLVAGGRVFVLGADRSVAAYDGLSGRRLWRNTRTGEALVLRQSGVLTAVGNTLVVGLSGHLVGMNPDNGDVVWDIAIANSRGTNDIERMVDLVGGISRDGNIVCVRAYQSALGCVDAARGRLVWKRSASGAVGLHGDDNTLYGAEGDGQLLAWRRSDGEPAWTSDLLRYRDLTAPLITGQAVVVGDETGLVHWLARMDGKPLTRTATDGSALASAPVQAGQTIVVVTRHGSVYGWMPGP